MISENKKAATIKLRLFFVDSQWEDYPMVMLRESFCSAF